jgi:predicted Zn-dependent protease
MVKMDIFKLSQWFYNNALRISKSKLEWIRKGRIIIFKSEEIPKKTTSFVEKNIAEIILDLNLDSKLYIDKEYRPLNEINPESESANIILLNRYIDKEKYYWGNGDFKKREMILALPEKRINSYKDIKIFTRHEFLHMLGLDHHYSKYTNNCVMKANPEKTKLCNECYVKIKSFWEGIDARLQ